MVGMDMLHAFIGKDRHYPLNVCAGRKKFFLHSSFNKTRAAHAEISCMSTLWKVGRLPLRERGLRTRKILTCSLHRGRAPAAQRGRHRHNCRPLTTHRLLPPRAHRLPHKHMSSAQGYDRENLPRCGEAAPIPCSAQALIKNKIPRAQPASLIFYLLSLIFYLLS